MNRFVLIKRDLLEANQPSSDCNVTGGHMVVVNGREIKAHGVVEGSIRLKVEPQNVYSICTEKRQHILVNGMKVLFWVMKNGLVTPLKMELSGKIMVLLNIINLKSALNVNLYFFQYIDMM